ncbi:hypothetical protein ACFQ1E_14450 [Sphingomonas canadensis]|uniref:Uncharacterized protein n=1 Tax=Sphingomonas canadensis TaxID=1219257 RepID=A0ABW3H7R9_9SPHN|nr:hypothetical protein [Sphingomonas canadensis]MCW3837216.1 hypothetical protein [Sphingomonas canadensis]
MTEAERKARLAEQLRANLRRRKAQAREIAAEAPEGDATQGEGGGGGPDSGPCTG